MAEELRQRFTRLKLPKDVRVAFISHHKATGGVVARLLHDRLCEILGLPSSGVFLDSNDLDNLAFLPDQVGKSLVLCLLQTGGILTRPYALVEVYSAFKKNIPVIAVTVEGTGYDFVDAESFLNAPDFATELDKRNPGASKVLEDMGIDLHDMAKVLGQGIPKVISIRFNPNENDRMLHASIEVILDKILTQIEKRAGYSNPGLAAFPSSSGPAKTTWVHDSEVPYASLAPAANDQGELQGGKCCSCRNKREARVCFVRVFSWQMCLFWGLLIAAGVIVIIVYFAVTLSAPKAATTLTFIETTIECTNSIDGFLASTMFLATGNCVALGTHSFDNGCKTGNFTEYNSTDCSTKALKSFPPDTCQSLGASSSKLNLHCTTLSDPEFFRQIAYDPEPGQGPVVNCNSTVKTVLFTRLNFCYPGTSPGSMGLVFTKANDTAVRQSLYNDIGCKSFNSSFDRPADGQCHINLQSEFLSLQTLAGNGQ